MNPKRKICCVSGSRAEYSLLFPIMRALKNAPDFELQIIVTGAHLSPEFGLTYQRLEEDGFDIQGKVEMLISSDSAVGIAKSVGLGVISFADHLKALNPDLILVLGDRYEIFSAVQTALILKIPVAHIAGGDVTEGAFDEAIRHSITKMSHLHFATNEPAKKRIIQLGENPQHVFNVGNPGLDCVKEMKWKTRKQLAEQLAFSLKPKNVLVTFHPETLESDKTTAHLQELLTALKKLPEDIGILFTGSNADPSGRAFTENIQAFAKENARSGFFLSLGRDLYLNTLFHVDMVIGNSSSGLYEVPTFKKPTINIGNRQQGRLCAQSVISCSPKTKEILGAIDKAWKLDCSKTKNPYGDGETSPKIINILRRTKDFKALLKKKFFDLEQ